MRRKMIGLVLLLSISVSTATAQQVDLDGKAIGRARQYEQYFRDAAVTYDVDARILWAIGYVESRFNPGAVSPKGARGLMQLLPTTAARFGAADPHEPISAINAAAKYLRLLLKRFDGRVDLALAAYNAGEETVEAYRTGRAIQIGEEVINPSRRTTGGVPPYRETHNYVAACLRILNQLSLSPAFMTFEPEESTAHTDYSERKSILYIDPSAIFHPLQIPQPKLAVRRSIAFSSAVE